VPASGFLPSVHAGNDPAESGRILLHVAKNSYRWIYSYIFYYTRDNITEKSININELDEFWAKTRIQILN
jgi:hypothetical protein